MFLDASILPDNMLVSIALEDAYHLGVLSSRIHVTWALAMGGRLGVGNDPRYNKTRCFGTFPFPDATDAQKARIRALAEELDSHRKRQQALHPKLTLTDMYNVLAKLRGSHVPGTPHSVREVPGTSSRMLSAKEKLIHEQGLVSILAQLHADLDATVADAYGWPADLPDEEILARLVALNAARAAEEAAGTIRWLRPEYQAPGDHEDLRGLADLEGLAAHGDLRGFADLEGLAAHRDLRGFRNLEGLDQPVAFTLRPWPDGMSEQAAAVRAALAAHAGRPVTPAEIAAAFSAAAPARIADWLATLVALGQARAADGGRFVAI